jgi:hypothetical protein
MLTEQEADYLQRIYEVGAETDPQKGRDCYNDWCHNFLFGSSPDFPKSNHDRFLEYGEDTNISARQWEMFDKIAGYLGVSR